MESDGEAGDVDSCSMVLSEASGVFGKGAFVNSEDSRDSIPVVGTSEVAGLLKIAISNVPTAATIATTARIVMRLECCRATANSVRRA